MSFSLTNIYHNPNGWGPEGIPEDLQNVPYSPLNLISLTQQQTSQQSQQQQQQQQQQNSLVGLKTDLKVGKVADWSQGMTMMQTKRKPVLKQQQEVVEETGDEFSTVFHSKQKMQKTAIKRTFQKPRYNRRYNKKYWPRNRYNWRGPTIRNLKPSIVVRASWGEPVHRYDFQLVKKSPGLEYIPSAEDIKTCGNLYYYDPSFDKISPKTMEPLKRFSSVSETLATTSEDPVLKQLMVETPEAEDAKVTVFGTDILLSIIMTATSSVFPWDLVIEKNGNVITIDKREGSNVDKPTSNENAEQPPVYAEDPSTNINSIIPLSEEAYVLNNNFAQHVLDKKKPPFSLDEKNPFHPTTAAYTYRKWKVTDDITVVARCSIDSIYEDGDVKKFMNIKALNEYDVRISSDWKTNMDSSRGAIIMDEIKNNGCKLSRWACQALLAGVHTVKLGFVTRANQSSNVGHFLIATEEKKSTQLAYELELKIAHGWKVLKDVIQAVNKKGNGKYVLMKEANSAAMCLYLVPYEDEEDDEEDKIEEDIEQLELEDELD